MARSVLVALVVVLLATACGAAESAPSLAEAAARTEDAGSSRFAISGTELDGSDEVEISCTGEADYDRERVSIACDYGKGTAEILAIGRTTYVRGDVFGFGGRGDKWLESTDDESLGAKLKPKRLLAMLRAASESSEEIGKAEIRGVETVGYRLVVECAAAELSGCAGETAPVEVWVGDDGLVRRIGVEETTAPFTFDFHDFGAEVSIEAPSPADVQDVGSLFGSEPCRAGFGKPIEAEQALSALRRHGFTVSSEGLECASESASFGNSPARAREEGRLHCVVRAAPPPGAPSRVQPLGPGVSANAFRLQNVECTLVADTGAESRVARLAAALRELER